MSRGQRAWENEQGTVSRGQCACQHPQNKLSAFLLISHPHPYPCLHPDPSPLSYHHHSNPLLMLWPNPSSSSHPNPHSCLCPHPSPAATTSTPCSCSGLARSTPIPTLRPPSSFLHLTPTPSPPTSPPALPPPHPRLAHRQLVQALASGGNWDCRDRIGPPA